MDKSAPPKTSVWHFILALAYTKTSFRYCTVFLAHRKTFISTLHCAQALWRQRSPNFRQGVSPNISWRKKVRVGNSCICSNSLALALVLCSRELRKPPIEIFSFLVSGFLPICKSVRFLSFPSSTLHSQGFYPVDYCCCFPNR